MPLRPFQPAWYKPPQHKGGAGPASTAGGPGRLALPALKPPAGWAGLESDNPPMRLLARLGADEPEVGDGLGGWDVTDRPQQVGMTTWKGNAPYTLSLPLMLDGFAEDADVEGQLALLYDVARGRDTEPGSVRVRGVYGLPASDWVITGIDTGASIRRESDGKRVRQELTLALLEYQPPDWESVKKGALQGAKARTHLVTVKRLKGGKGETPAQMAKRLKVKWTELRELNKGVVKTANAALKPGTKLRAPLPAASSSKRHKTAKKGKR